MSDEIKYFNFPVTLLQGFMIDSNSVLNDVLCYCFYLKVNEYYESDDFNWTANHDDEKICSLFKSYYGINVLDPANNYERGKELYESIPPKTPFTGVSVNTICEYFKNEKSDFDKACFLAFAALKSILQKQAYTKITNKYLLSRMDGKCQAIITDGKKDYTGISNEIFAFSNDYQLRKIKMELCESWGLVTYSRYIRGFYVSFQMSLEDLVYEAEKNRKSYRIKKANDQQKSAIEKAMSRLNESSRP